MKEIPLSNGGVALVDDEDYEGLSRWTWRADRKGYVRRTVYIGRINGKHKVRDMKMHREIMGDVPGVQYDHINGDKKDNRKANLRPATNQQNGWNAMRMRGEFSSRYKGVNWKRSHRAWHARVRVNGRDIHCGFFRNEIDAAIAYDQKVREMRGEFARLNFPREGEQSALRTA